MLSFAAENGRIATDIPECPMRNLLRSALTVILAAALTLAAFAGTASASVPPAPAAPPQQELCLATKCFPREAQAALQNFLGTVASIPDSVLRKGNDATKKWLAQNSKNEGSNPGGARRVSTLLPAEAAPTPATVLTVARTETTAGTIDAANFIVPSVNVWGCAMAIGAVLVAPILPIAKLIKIKALIKDLGGVVKATRLLIGAGTTAEKLEGLGTALALLIAELTGIKGIADNCF